MGGGRAAPSDAEHSAPMTLPGEIYRSVIKTKPFAGYTGRKEAAWLLDSHK